MKNITLGIILFVSFSQLLTGYKNTNLKSAPIDYCSKIDTLIKESNSMYSKHPKNFDRILNEIETNSKIKGTYKFGFSGRVYCDTFFNNDVRRWATYFGCKEFHLRSAGTEITNWCDTTTFKEGD